MFLLVSPSLYSTTKRLFHLVPVPSVCRNEPEYLANIVWFQWQLLRFGTEKDISYPSFWVRILLSERIKNKQTKNMCLRSHGWTVTGFGLEPGVLIPTHRQSPPSLQTTPPFLGSEGEEKEEELASAAGCQSYLNHMLFLQKRVWNQGYLSSFLLPTSHSYIGLSLMKMFLECVPNPPHPPQFT